MTLAEFVSDRRRRIFDDLVRGADPSEGRYSATALKEGRVKGAPQLGSVHFEPHEIVLEFIYPDRSSVATVLAVRLDSPERIVFMPVPGWVIESIWQGEIDGSFHFEADARRLVAEFEAELAEGGNAHWFGRRHPKRRE